MKLSLFGERAHDPWYDLEGETVRAQRRRRQFVSSIAFALSLTALFGATLAWTSLLGVNLFGLHVALAL
jgi:hypothetical protein